MDDYNIAVLSEAKSEYSKRLVSILVPLVLEGVKSIFSEANKLCIDNDEEDKYLMTFQNFLSRVPKWNSTIIEEETKRIVTMSKCNYLEDLLTCVHITQLKILTSIRVSQKQKKIDIDIPKLKNFIHKCYISYARKLYSNVYLFEKDILPLEYQKNMREAELMCQESILQVVRDSMPVETILRAYIDETVDEEIIEETIEQTVTEAENKEEAAKESVENVPTENSQITKTDEVAKIEKKEEINDIKKPKLESSKNSEEESTPQNINLVIQTPVSEADDKPKSNPFLPVAESSPKVVAPPPKEEATPPKEDATPPKEDATPPKEDATPLKQAHKDTISFSNKDTVLDLNTNRKSVINAPKTLERLEKISAERHAERKKADEAEDAEEAAEEDKLVIHNNTALDLEKIDIHDLNKKINVKPDPVLDDIEVLI